MPNIKVAHISREGTVLLVPSEGTTGAYFAVEHKKIKKTDEWKWTCTCPAFLFQRGGRQDCKHISVAKEFLKEHADSEDKRIAPLAMALATEEI